MNKVVSIFCLMFLCSSAVLADPIPNPNARVLQGAQATAYTKYFAGLVAYNKQNYQEALKLWLPLAQQPDNLPEPENGQIADQIACIYFQGKGGTQDFAEAFKWAQVASKQHSGGNSCNFFSEVWRELGTDSLSDAEEVRQYPIALNERHKREERAAKGDVAAQLALGKFYGPGKWGLPDLTKAATYYEMAAEQGNFEAQKGMCFLLARGGLMTDADAAKQYTEKAADWCERLAEAGDADSQKNLGRIYTSAYGRPYSPSEALKWYLKWADQKPQLPNLKAQAEEGDADAQFALGTMYSCIPEALDVNDALTWWRRAAEQGNWRAQVALGQALYPGGIRRVVGSGKIEFVGMHPDQEEAYFWYGVALQSGNLPKPPEPKHSAALTFSQAPMRIDSANIEQAKNYASRGFTSMQMDTVQKRVEEWKPKLEKGWFVNSNPEPAPDWVCGGYY